MKVFLLPAVRSLAAGRAILLTLLNVAALFAMQPEARAQADATLTILYRVPQSSSGPYPYALTLGSDGNFYGASANGGAYSEGFVFKLTPAGVMTDLHDFGLTNAAGANTDGIGPSGLTQGSDGNLYGVTGSGGTEKGTFFKMTPAGVLTVLHQFGGTLKNFDAHDALFPSSGLVLGSDGNFHGLSNEGGLLSGGTFYRVTAAGKVTVLHSFSGSSGDVAPISGLTAGIDGNFYGITADQVERITPTGALTAIYSFSYSDGHYTGGALLQGHDGNFYGTFISGGTRADGTVFQLTPTGQLTILHNFFYGDGDSPEGPLVSDSDDNLYGTCYHGGTHSRGTVFRLTPAGQLTVLHSFSADEGSSPRNGVLLDSSGDLCGLCRPDDEGDDSTVFKLHVNAIHPPFFLNEAPLSDSVYYLAFDEQLFDNTLFGYYSYLSDPHYIYHFDMGYEYVSDAADGNGGVYFYDFKSKTFFYTSPVFPFPYLYDFTLKTILYYYPNPDDSTHYNTDGVRYFYDFATGKVITK